MTDPDTSPSEHLERAGDLVWQAVQTLEEAQRVLFRAGDGYVAEGAGAGVQRVLQLAERITEATGDLTSAHIAIARLAREGPRDRGWS